MKATKNFCACMCSALGVTSGAMLAIGAPNRWVAFYALGAAMWAGCYLLTDFLFRPRGTFVSLREKGKLLSFWPVLLLALFTSCSGFETVYSEATVWRDGDGNVIRVERTVTEDGKLVSRVVTSYGPHETPTPLP